jgi:hypothetical protein
MIPKTPKAPKAAKGAGAKAAGAALSGLLGGGLPLSQIMPGQVRLNEMRPTPFVPPKTTRKGSGKKR